MKIFYKTTRIPSDIIGGGRKGDLMKKRTRTMVYDDRMYIEAYRFEGSLWRDQKSFGTRGSPLPWLRCKPAFLTRVILPITSIALLA
jgi:hypothetical protein